MTDTAPTHALRFFEDRYGLDDRSLQTTLDSALERRVDYADLYFEYTSQESVALEEGIVKSGSRHLEQGVGVRVQSEERQGYAHSDEISLESLRIAASTARAIARITPLLRVDERARIEDSLGIERLLERDEDVVRSYSNGACSYIAKPVDPDAFREVVKQFELYWTLVSRIPQAH